MRTRGLLSGVLCRVLCDALCDALCVLAVGAAACAVPAADDDPPAAAGAGGAAIPAPPGPASRQGGWGGQSGQSGQSGQGAGASGSTGGAGGAPRADAAPVAPDAGAPASTGSADAGDPPARPVPGNGSIPGVGAIVFESPEVAMIPRPHSPKVLGTLAFIEKPVITPAGLDVTRSPVVLTAKAGVSYHGNSSFGSYPMKSLEFEFWDDGMQGTDRAVFGFPPGSDFCLWACYADKTCLRNWLTYDLMRGMGRWASRTKFVEVFLKTGYNGLYLMEESNRRDRNRVAIPRPAPDMASGDITGGYLLRFDTVGPTFRSVSGMDWMYHYPRATNITAAQKVYIKAAIDKVDTLLASPAYQDPKAGYQSVVDLPSFVDGSIIHELTSNPDAYWRSQYFHKQSDANGGKLHMGPIWDFDLSYGTTNLRSSYQHDFFQYQREAAEVPKIPFKFWSGWARIWADPAFQNAVKCRWSELRKSRLIDPAALAARIDEGVKMIAEAEVRHHAKWKVIGQNVPPLEGSVRQPTYAADVQYLKDWLRKRIVWLDANLPGACAN